jgi:hypothetical protein
MSILKDIVRRKRLLFFPPFPRSFQYILLTYPSIPSNRLPFRHKDKKAAYSSYHY